MMIQVKAKLIIMSCMKMYLYEVEYTDGTAEKQTANIIAENMMSQVDSQGHQYQVLTKVTGHNKHDQRQVPRDFPWYDDHHQQVLVGQEVKKRWS